MPKISIEPVVARLEEAFTKSLRTIPAHQAGGGEMFFVTSVDIQSLRHLTERDEEHIRRMREISPYAVDLQLCELIARMKWYYLLRWTVKDMHFRCCPNWP